MKILQVMAGAEHGGAETAFVDMCLALAEAGEQIEVVTRPNDLRVERLQKAGLKIHELRFGGALDFYKPLKMKKIIAAFEPHIVQTWMSRAACKTPSWQEGDPFQQYLNVSRLGGYYKLKYFKHTDYFVTITPDIKRYLVENGVEDSRVIHINNFAETEQADDPVSRESLDTPENAIVLLALGRLHKAKAIDTLQKAVRDVPGVYLWIAGEGPQREELETLCATLGLQDRVRFLGWRDDRAALFQAADICVFPSRFEPFGTVFVQAWEQKTPVITSDADGPRQFVKDGEDGLIFPVDDVSALSHCIKRLIDNQDLADKLVLNGYRRYMSEFTREKCVQAYLSFYHEILEKQGLVAAA